MSWIQNAKVGDKVVCLHKIPGNGVGDEIRPVVGAVYTIRGMIPVGDLIGLTLEEILNSSRDYDDGAHEFCFHWINFRPVEPHKTDISIFEKLLQSAPADQPMEDA